MAISLDGFIARENGDTSWLHSPKYNFDKEEDYGFLEFMNSVDYLVMGRNTFERVKEFSPWPYSKKVIVLSNSLKEIPAGLEDKIELFSGEINFLIERFNTEGVKRIRRRGQNDSVLFKSKTHHGPYPDENTHNPLKGNSPV